MQSPVPPQLMKLRVMMKEWRERREWLAEGEERLLERKESLQ